MVDTIVDKSYKDFLGLITYLEEKKEISLKNDADNNFKKVLLLTAASYFENEITTIIKNLIETNSNEKKIIISFVSKKAIERQYHTYFQWKEKNVNAFLSLFGDDFKTQCVKDIDSNDELKKGVKDFMELGRVRNELIHKNFGIYTIDMTAKDVYEKFKSAMLFLEFFKSKIA